MSIVVKVATQILALTSLPDSKCFAISSFFLAMEVSFFDLCMLILLIDWRKYDCLYNK